MFRRWVPISFIAVAIALALAGGAVLAAGGEATGVIPRALLDREQAGWESGDVR